MSNDHIGIPRFIQEGFAKSGIVSSYDVSLDRIRTSPITKLGTETNYYENDVEKVLLARLIEGEFSKLYKDITGTTNIDFIKHIIANNKELISQFFSFMYLRAKKMLKTVNENSLSSKLFGDINHSELLRIQSEILVNPLKMIDEEYEIRFLVNFSKVKLINNSLGIGAMIKTDGKVTFFVPLNTRVGLIFCDKDFAGGLDCFYIPKDDDRTAIRLNHSIVQFEKDYGNGFLFAKTRDDIEEPVSYFRQLIKK